MTHFQAVQRELTAFLRRPGLHAGPAGVEQRRLDIYRDLIYNNIESFLATGFPVLHSLYTEKDWHALVRDFVASHLCASPYFSEISEEFLAYLQVERGQTEGDPAFLVELAHYEWVELALDIAPEDLSDIALSVDGDLLKQRPLISPLAWPLVYQYPVHLIGPEFQPEVPADTPSYLVVYRDLDDDVRFMQINAITFRLLQLLQDETIRSGAAALEQVGLEINHPEPEALLKFGEGLLADLREASVILGTVPGS